MNKKSSLSTLYPMYAGFERDSPLGHMFKLLVSHVNSCLFVSNAVLLAARKGAEFRPAPQGSAEGTELRRELVHVFVRFTLRHDELGSLLDCALDKEVRAYD